MVVISAFLTSCAVPPPGADGDLFDDWPTFAEPAMTLPQVGQCYDGPIDDVDDLGSGRLRLIDSCAGEHLTETYHIGTFTGEAAAASTLPTGDELLRDAWAECDVKASEFLGGEWRNSRLEIRVVRPTSAQWFGGARHFRCDVAEVRSQVGVLVPRTGSVKDGLRGTRPLAPGCFHEVEVGDGDEGFDDLTPVACSEEHDAEYAGTFVPAAGLPPEGGDSTHDFFFDGCGKVVAAYIGITPAQLDGHRQITYSYWWRGRERWPTGDRAATCFAHVPKAPAVRVSIRGLGTRRIPGT